jgi:hypothetical protein
MVSFFLFVVSSSVNVSHSPLNVIILIWILAGAEDRVDRNMKNAKYNIFLLIRDPALDLPERNAGFQGRAQKLLEEI